MTGGSSLKTRGRRFLKHAAAVSAALLLLVFPPDRAVPDAADPLPFSPGEQLVFEIKWGPIPAGRATLEVLPGESEGETERLHFVMTARTYPYVDLFYKVRGRIDAYTDAKMTHSFLYVEKKEGRREKHVVINLDQEKRWASYANFGRKRKPVSIRPGTFDPLSVFYAFRAHGLRENKVIRIPVTDGKKCVMGRATVIRREKVDVSGRVYDTYLVEPDLEHIGGVFEQSRDAKLQIWVTADSRRMPVRIKSRVVVGSFVAELISATQGERSLFPDGPRPEEARPPEQLRSRSHESASASF